MTTIRDILSELLRFAPKDLKEDWDNVGLLCGRKDKPVNSVLVSLDVTMAVVHEAQAMGADLIVSHHPLLFSADCLSDETPQGELLLTLARADIGVISMHTNLDSTQGGVNDILAQCLELQNIRTFDGSACGIGRIGEIEAQSLCEFAHFVKQQLRANGVRYADGGKPVHCVAVGGGACMDFLPQAMAAGCDTFVTGDVKYHQFQKAASLGVNLIDAGHFPTEDPVCQTLCGLICTAFPELSVRKSEIHSDCVIFA